MPKYEVGEAFIKIVPSADGFFKKLEADLKSIDAELPVRLVADVAPIRADIARLRDSEHADDLTIQVDADTSRARREIAAVKSEFDAAKALTALKFNVGVIGVGNLPAVATALASVAGAAQQVAQAGLVLPGVFAAGAATIGTFKLATAGVADAFKAVEKSADGSAASIKAANEALAGLAPSAREAVLAASSIKTELKNALQLPVQDNLFRGLAEDARKLVDSDLPVLQKGLGGIATSLNSNIHQVFTSLGSDRSKGLLDQILGNTSDAQYRITKAIDPLLHAFEQLGATSTNALPRLADGFGTVATHFDKFITAAAQDGRLDKWINDGITAAGHLGNTLLNVGKAFTAITEAAGGGGGLLAMLDTGSEKLAKFLNSTTGQADLKKFFDDGKQQLEKWLPILESLPGLFTGVLNASREWADVILPPLGQISSFLGEHKTLVQGVAEAFLAWKTIDGVTNLLGSLGLVSKSLRTEMPAAAAEGAAGVNKALALIVVPEIAKMLNDQLDKFLKEHAPDLDKANHAGEDSVGGPVDWGARLNPWSVENRNRRAADPQAGPTPTDPRTGLPATQSNAPADKDSRESGGVPGVGNTPLPPWRQAELQPTIPGRAHGGEISGGVPGKDSVLLAGMPGEHMLTVADVAAMGGQGNVYAFRRALHSGRLRGYANGGAILDENGNLVGTGPAPGPAPVAPSPFDGGGVAGSILGSLFSGAQGPLGLLNLAGGQATDTPGLQTQHGSGTLVQQPASLADRAAGLPGLWGLLGSAFSSDPDTNIANWGESTGKWLGNFASRAIGGFATSLWSGALGLVGLENSILSPNNTWNRAGQSIGQFAFSSDGPLGVLLGANDGPGSASSGKGPTAKQSREAGEKITRADQKVAEIQQRIAELPADAKDSQRLSLNNQLVNAQQEAADARADYAGLQTGSSRTIQAGAYTVGVQPPAGTGAERWRPAVRQALATFGPRFGITNVQAWEDALVRQIQTESGGNPGADNPGDSNGRGGTQHVSGLLQFLPSTFAANNITGGAYLDPYAQVAAAIQYVAKTYGMDANGAPRQIGRGVGYYTGGEIVGPRGLDAVPLRGTAGEWVIKQASAQKYGPAAMTAVNAGTAAINPTPSRPDFSPGDSIGHLNPGRGAAVIPSAPTTPLPVAPPAAPAPVATPPEQQQQTPAPQRQTYTGPVPVAPGPDELNHNLPAINTGIASGAAAIGNLAATAASTAAAAGTFGAAGAGGGGAGSLIAGGIQEVGKIATDVANVGSSFLVGNVTAGTTPNAYGELNLAAQNAPLTAPDNRRSYVFNGVDGRTIVDDIRLKDAQDMQAQLANF